MVLDRSKEQAQKLEVVLKWHFDQNDIFYGIHYSSSALMTCMVQSITPGEHIHFIDGSDGGYAIAAKAMKEQMKVRQAKAS